MILCLKKRGLFSSYCPIQEEWLAPGALEKLLYTYSARPSPLYIALFRSVELESHHLLFTVTVLTSPLPRALNLDVFSRKYSGVTYSMEENKPTRIVAISSVTPSVSFFLAMLLLSGKNVTSSWSQIYHCSGNVTYLLFVQRYHFVFFAHPCWQWTLLLCLFKADSLNLRTWVSKRRELSYQGVGTYRQWENLSGFLCADRTALCREWAAQLWCLTSEKCLVLVQLPYVKRLSSVGTGKIQPWIHFRAHLEDLTGCNKRSSQDWGITDSRSLYQLFSSVVPFFPL